MYAIRSYYAADVGFIFIAYNLKRIINIIGKNQLMAYLGAYLALYIPVTKKIKREISLLYLSKPLLNEIRIMQLFINLNFSQRFYRKLPIALTGF